MFVGKFLIAPQLFVGAIIMALAAIFSSPWWWIGVVVAVMVGLFLAFAEEPDYEEKTPKRRPRWPENDG